MNTYSTKGNDYWHSIDLVKGFLIIFVFIGHIIPGIQRETFLRYLIYSFHMPLFIGISGFLFNIQKDVSLGKKIIKYVRRLIIPWVIAVTCYFIINKLITNSLNRITLREFIYQFIYPFYHLWFIIGLVSYITITSILYKGLKRFKKRWLYICFISFIISIIFKFNLNNNIMEIYNMKKIYKYIQQNFRLYNLIFFTLGCYLRYRYEQNRNIITRKKIKYVKMLTYLNLITIVILFFFNFSNIESIMYYVMNIFLIIVVIYDCINIRIPRNEKIEFIGKYSLSIYLYHIMCKILAVEFFVEGSFKYYTTCVSTFIFMCICVYYLNVFWLNYRLSGTVKIR